MDREKVIEWADKCTSPEHKSEDCNGCPYHSYHEGFYSCIEYLMMDAVELLEEQEPRIITLEDFENNQKLDDSGHLNVWEEYKDGSRSGWNTINVNDVSCFSDIRRYWTDRPTEEQRKAVKWE